MFDEGRTVWEWQTATGVFERHVSEEQMARLEHAGLQLVDQATEGRAIYGADQTGSQVAYSARKQVFVGRPAPRRSAHRDRRVSSVLASVAAVDLKFARSLTE